LRSWTDFWVTANPVRIKHGFWLQFHLSAPAYKQHEWVGYQNTGVNSRLLPRAKRALNGLFLLWGSVSVLRSAKWFFTKQAVQLTFRRGVPAAPHAKMRNIRTNFVAAPLKVLKSNSSLFSWVSKTVHRVK